MMLIQVLVVRPKYGVWMTPPLLPSLTTKTAVREVQKHVTPWTLGIKVALSPLWSDLLPALLPFLVLRQCSDYKPCREMPVTKAIALARGLQM